jgi:hypothetical protein
MRYAVEMENALTLTTTSNAHVATGLAVKDAKL